MSVHLESAFETEVCEVLASHGWLYEDKTADNYDRQLLRHWFHTANRHTGGIPAELVQRTEGLVEIVQYLDAMRAPI